MYILFQYKYSFSIFKKITPFIPAIRKPEYGLVHLSLLSTLGPFLPTLHCCQFLNSSLLIFSGPCTRCPLPVMVELTFPFSFHSFCDLILFWYSKRFPLMQKRIPLASWEVLLIHWSPSFHVTFMHFQGLSFAHSVLLLFP